MEGFCGCVLNGSILSARAYLTEILWHKIADNNQIAVAAAKSVTDVFISTLYWEKVILYYAVTNLLPIEYNLLEKKLSTSYASVFNIDSQKRGNSFY